MGRPATWLGVMLLAACSSGVVTPDGGIDAPDAAQPDDAAIDLVTPCLAYYDRFERLGCLVVCPGALDCSPAALCDLFNSLSTCCRTVALAEIECFTSVPDTMLCEAANPDGACAPQAQAWWDCVSPDAGPTLADGGCGP